jgi:DNA-binding transcriptional LysR family regulator
MRSLNLDQLRALETVVELASFTGAARRLNLSQSAISVQIRELEERCGVRLVERLGKKAYATAAGREVIEHARRISEEADAITSAMRRFREGWIGRVHIGAALTALMYLLPPALQKLRAEHPGIDLFVSNATTAGMVDGVLRNEIDIGVVTLPVEDSRLTITPLHIDPLVAILPASNRDIPPEITPDYVAGQFLVLEFGGVSRLVTDWLSSARTLPSQSSMVVSAVEAIKIVVSAGMGVSIVPSISVLQPGDDFIVRPIRPAVTRTLALIQHRNKPDELALRTVRQVLMELSNVPKVGEIKTPSI